MIRLARALREREEGQTIVLGAACLLIVAMSILVTIQLGHAVHQRIKLQDSADAAAYSTAAAVARSFNFFAYSNRAQVVHYVGMMIFQSLASFVTGVEALMGFSRDLAATIEAIACAISFYCGLCRAVPIIGVACTICWGAFKLIAEVANAIKVAAKTAMDILKNVRDLIDQPVALAVKGLWYFNADGYFNLQRGYKVMMVAALGAGTLADDAFTNRILNDNDAEEYRKPTARPGAINKDAQALKSAMNLLNTVDFAGIFDEKAEALPNKTNDQDDAKRHAERIMAEVTNGTRSGRVGAPVTFLTNRSVFGKSNSTVSKVLDKIGLKYSGSTKFTEQMQSPTGTSVQNFTRDTGMGFGDLGGGAPANPQCENAMQQCNDKQNQCQNMYDNEVVPARQATASAQSALDSCRAAQPPRNCSSEQSNLSQKQSDQNAAEGRARNCSEDAQRQCEGSAGDCTPPGLGGLNPDLANDVWENGNVFNNEANEDSARGGGRSQLSLGRVLSSAEWMSILGNFGRISGGGGEKIVGIMGGDKSDFSYHCRYDDPPNKLGPFALGCEKYHYSKPVKCDKEGGRHFFGRISGWIKFKPDSDPAKDFNMPEFWTVANKAPRESSFGARSDTMPNALGLKTGQKTASGGGRTGKLEKGLVGEEGGFLIFPSGLNALARARVYYHRPQNWNEHPNFFNPFWKAKLSAIAPKLDKLGVAGVDFSDVGSYLVTH